jgi:hypothetical protein
MGLGDWRRTQALFFSNFSPIDPSTSSYSIRPQYLLNPLCFYMTQAFVNAPAFSGSARASHGLPWPIVLTEDSGHMPDGFHWANHPFARAAQLLANLRMGVAFVPLQTAVDCLRCVVHDEYQSRTQQLAALFRRMLTEIAALPFAAQPSLEESMQRLVQIHLARNALLAAFVNVDQSSDLTPFDIGNQILQSFCEAQFVLHPAGLAAHFQLAARGPPSGCFMGLGYVPSDQSLHFAHFSHNVWKPLAEHLSLPLPVVDEASEVRLIGVQDARTV